jgi:predicted O-methyltransferase YrrM
MKKLEEALKVISDARARAVLRRLHEEAARQELSLRMNVLPYLHLLLLKRKMPWKKIEGTLDKYYMAIEPDQAAFCYLITKSIGAKKIIEFGTSFGISTIYLALAVRENGGGVVVGTELVESKARQAKRNVDEAGLSDFVDIRIGNAMETLKNETGPVDFFFNDGFPPLALPVTKIVAPLMREGGVIFSDNVNLFKADYQDYLDYLRNPNNGFRSMLLGFSDPCEFTVKTGVPQ